VIHPPKARLSELVNSLKGVSSQRLKVEFPKERGRDMVPELFHWFGWRRPY
jgi:hypothetical protein